MAISVVRKGATAALAGSRSSTFIGVGEGEQLEFAMLTPLDEIVSFDQHVFWGDAPENTVMFPCLQTPDCPGELLGNRPRLRVLLLVAYKNDDGALVAGILPIGLTVLRTLVDIDSALPGGIKGATLILKRSGSGLKTRYTLISTGNRLKKTVETDINLEDAVGETDRSAIIAMLMNAGVDISPIEAYDSKSALAAAHGKAPGDTKDKRRGAVQKNAEESTEPEQLSLFEVAETDEANDWS